MIYSSLKQTIEQALESNSLESIASLAVRNRRVLSVLVRAAYDKDTLAGWRAIKAVGLVARELVRIDPEFLRETIRKLLWSLSDESGGIGWSAPEIIGEIIAVEPEKFSDIIPLIAEVYAIEEDVFRPGVMYAMARIAEASPKLVIRHQGIIFKALSDSKPETRFYALEAFRSIKSHLSQQDLDDFINVIKSMVSDSREIWVYLKKNFIPVTVGESAHNFLS